MNIVQEVKELKKYVGITYSTHLKRKGYDQNKWFRANHLFRTNQSFKNKYFELITNK